MSKCCTDPQNNPFPEPENGAGSGMRGSNGMDDRALSTEKLIAVGRDFYRRNWIPGTAGNFSAVVSHLPFELAITKSGVHKGSLTESDFIYVDRFGRSLQPCQDLSAESPLHQAIIAAGNAGAVLYTQSVWSSVLAHIYADDRGLWLQGFEALKGLSGITSYQQGEWLPILENSEDYPGLAAAVAGELKAYPQTHAILLRNHGLYTWAATIEAAARQTEIFELLFEVIVRELHICGSTDPSEVRIN